MDKLYTIQEVATKLNLSDKTLRRWEEAGRFTPSRTLGNQRRYSLEDLQILDAIKHGTINEQKDLLTVDQAGKLCGVSSTTLARWENTGKIHPFITSGNTYYPRAKLMEKMDELKRDAPVQADTMTFETMSPLPLETVLPPTTLMASPIPSPIPYSIYITQTLITLLLLFSYHLFFNQTSTPARNATHSVAGGPISPQPGLATGGTGAIQGASTAAPDPRLNDLIIKFQDHLAGEMLKEAKPIPITTVNLDNTSLITGTTTLPKGKNQISVPADKITLTTPVTVTFNSDYAPAKKYWTVAGEGSFTVNTDFPVSADSAFNYSFLAPTSTPSAIIKP